MSSLPFRKICLSEYFEELDDSFLKEARVLSLKSTSSPQRHARWSPRLKQEVESSNVGMYKL